MKKLIMLALVLVPSLSFGAYQIAQEIQRWDYKAQIINDRGNVYIYEVKIGTSTCYVAQQNVGAAGSALAMSCK